VQTSVVRTPKALLVASAAAIAVAIAAPAVSRRFLFPGKAGATMPDDFVVHALRADDGATVRAYELRATRAARTVVYFHNNRETALDCVPLARALRDRGYAVVVMEYRGYGASAAQAPSERALYEDAAAVLAMLRARGVDARDITLWGTSLGTGIAAEMARRGLGTELVLVSPYTSIPDLVTDAAPIVPARVLLDDHFDTLAKASAIAMPTLVVHGDADDIVPFRMGERVARAIRGAQLLRIAGGGHADWRARALERILDALAALRGKSP